MTYLCPRRKDICLLKTLLSDCYIKKLADIHLRFLITSFYLICQILHYCLRLCVLTTVFTIKIGLDWKLEALQRFGLYAYEYGYTCN